MFKFSRGKVVREQYGQNPVALSALTVDVNVVKLTNPEHRRGVISFVEERTFGYLEA